MTTTTTTDSTLYATIRVRTTYTGPSNFSGSKITARASGQTYRAAYDYGSANPHKDAARELAARVAGGLLNAARVETAEPRYVGEHARGCVYDIDVRIEG